MREFGLAGRRKLLSALYLLLALAIGSPLAVQAQFQDTLKLKGLKSDAKKPLAEFSVELAPVKTKAGEFVLTIAAKLPPDHYIRSMNPGDGAETKVTFSKSEGVEAAEEFKPDHLPKIIEDPDLEQTVEKYFNKVTWTRRYKLLPKAKPADVKLAGTIKYQICDKSTCRPNQKFEFDVKPDVGEQAAADEENTELPAPAAVVKTAPAGATRFEHRSGIKREGPASATWTATVSPRQAKPGDEVTLTIRAELRPEWHIYAVDQRQTDDGGPEATAIGLTKTGGLEPLGPYFTAPAPRVKKSEAWDNLEERYYEGSVAFSRKFKVPSDAAGAISFSGKVGYQICTSGKCETSGFTFEGSVLVAEQAVPEARELTLAGPLKLSEAAEVREEFGFHQAVSNASPSPRHAPEENEPGGKAVAAENAPAGRGLEQFKAQGLPLFLGAAVLAGFAALLTPCVFPMIPITVSFFQKQSEKQHHRPMTMATVYCLGIIGTFTALGMLMSVLFGAASLTTLANNPWLNIFIAGVLIFFAMNLLGMFEIRMPGWLLTYTAGQESRGGFVGVLFMALTFTLTSFTCTFAFAGGLLAAAANGDRLWPVLGLLAFSAAFSLPFFFLALFPSLLKKLPKSGGWMNVVKVVMGLVEFGAAFKFLSVADLSWHPVAWVFDYELVMSAWMIISITAGMYLLGTFRLPHDMAADHIGVGRFIGAMSFLGLAAYLGVGLYSAEKPSGKVWENIVAFAPPKFHGGTESYGPVLDHGGIKYALDYQRAIEFAAKQNKPVLLDFTGVNCTNCRRMEQGPLSNPKIVERLRQFVCIQVYIDRVPHVPNDESRRLKEKNIELQEAFGDVSLPTYVVVPADKNLTKNTDNILAAFIGFDPDEERFAEFLDDGLSRWQTKMARAAGGRVVGRR